MKEISTTASGPSLNNNYQRPLKSYCIFWIMTTQIDIIAKQMLAEKLEPELISRVTGLTPEDLAKL